MIQLSRGLRMGIRCVHCEEGYDLIELLEDVKSIVRTGMEPMPMLGLRRGGELRIQVFDRPMCPLVGEAVWATLQVSFWDEFIMMSGIPEGKDELKFIRHRGPKSAWKPGTEDEGFIGFVRGDGDTIVFSEVRFR